MTPTKARRLQPAPEPPAPEALRIEEDGRRSVVDLDAHTPRELLCGYVQTIYAPLHVAYMLDPHPGSSAAEPEEWEYEWMGLARNLHAERLIAARTPLYGPVLVKPREEVFA